MDDHILIMAVASYASKDAAELDFAVLCGVHGAPLGQVGAAVVEKGPDGCLTMDRHHSTPSGPTAGGLLLGAALVVLAAPLGLRFLSSVIVRPETWVAVAGLAAELWHNVPRAELHRMETLVEARQASLVVVSVDQTKQEVETRLAQATARIVADA